MLRDEHSDYKWFLLFAETSASNAATAIIDWCAAFGMPNGLMSDRPTNFKNETIWKISKGLRVPHHFTLPYCPWSNGVVERLGKELVRTYRAILYDLQLSPEEWDDILTVVQSVLNNAPYPQRLKPAPVTMFIGVE